MVDAVQVHAAVTGVTAAVEKAVVGRRSAIDAALAAVLADGHVLLEGAPGTAKTLLVRALALTMGSTYKRIQFTPDLMPADITGTNVFDPQKAAFRLLQGPVFSQFILADEINRAPAKTQAALLECMEERTVTIDGISHGLPRGFTVFATMNPVEFEGTFALPEAQLDRFMMKIRLGDLEEAAERDVVARSVAGFSPTDLAAAQLTTVINPDTLASLRAAVGQVAVEPEVQNYLVEVTRRTRVHPAVALGASTRAAVALVRASRARAACLRRDYVIPDDIKALAPNVLAHRLSLRPEAQLEDVDGARVIAEILDAVPVPRA